MSKRRSPRPPNLSLPEAYSWFQLVPEGECLIWPASRTSGGYGQLNWGGRPHPAHRVAYEIAYGPIPDGMQIDHICHNRPCCKLSHLRMVTNKQNAENHIGAHRDSSTGVQGVYVCKSTGRYAVQVGHEGRNHWGGRFESLEQAEQAARALRNSLFTHNIHDRRAS